MDVAQSHTPKGARARDKIVRVAEKLLASSGFHGTSIGIIDARERSYSRRVDGLVRALVAWSEADPGRVNLLVREGCRKTKAPRDGKRLSFGRWNPAYAKLIVEIDQAN